MPLDLTDKSTMVWVMAWCRQATSHYLNQCWPRSCRHMASLGHNELTRSALLQLMTCCLISAKSLPEPMMTNYGVGHKIQIKWNHNQKRQFSLKIDFSMLSACFGLNGLKCFYFFYRINVTKVKFGRYPEWSRWTTLKHRLAPHFKGRK